MFNIRYLIAGMSFACGLGLIYAEWIVYIQKGWDALMGGPLWFPIITTLVAGSCFGYVFFLLKK